MVKTLHIGVEAAQVAGLAEVQSVAAVSWTNVKNQVNGIQQAAPAQVDTVLVAAP
jgi:hypothetical protein